MNTNEVPNEVLIANIKGETYTVETGVLSPDMVLGLLRKGWQEILADATAGKETDAERVQAIEARAAAIRAGTYSFGAARGPRVDRVTQLIREQAEGLAKRVLGLKTAEAAKLARNPQVVADKLAAHFGKPEAGPDILAKWGTKAKADHEAEKEQAKRDLEFFQGLVG